MKHRLIPSLRGLVTIAGICACGPAEYRAYFNIPPVDGAANPSIKDKLVAYINGAQPGSEIRGHIEGFGSDSVAASLINAHKRGVTVYLVANGDPSGGPPDPDSARASATLEDYFGTRHKYCFEDLGSASVTSCVSSVPGATQHIKMWAFSHTVVDDDDIRFAVFVTSADVTGESDGQFNDAFVVSGNGAPYWAYVESFKSYYNQTRSDDFYNVPGRGRHAIPSANVEISFSPQKQSPTLASDDPANDHVALALSRVDAYERGCALKAANLSFSNNREAIITQLRRIKALGCAVQIAYAYDYLGSLRYDLMADQIELRVATQTGIHSKMMLYNGRYDGTPHKVVVWGGSHNWTPASLEERDDVFVAVSNRHIYSAYSAYFDVIWNRSTPPR